MLAVTVFGCSLTFTSPTCINWCLKSFVAEDKKMSALETSQWACSFLLPRAGTPLGKIWSPAVSEYTWEHLHIALYPFFMSSKSISGNPTRSCNLNNWTICESGFENSYSSQPDCVESLNCTICDSVITNETRPDLQCNPHHRCLWGLIECDWAKSDKLVLISCN